LNFTPNTIEFASPASTVPGVPKSKIVSCGVTALDALDAGPVPPLLIAATVNVYAVPFVRPVTVALVAGGEPVTVVGVWAVEPTYGVTVYPVIALPPVLPGAVQLTSAWLVAALAVTPVGAPGGLACTGVTLLDCADAGPVPTALVALTVNVYAVPFVSPVTVALVAGGDPVTVVGVWAVEPMYGVTV
jgi:hypothetical protein